MWSLQDIMTHSLDESRTNPRQAMAHIGEIGYTVTALTPLGKLAEVGYFIRPPYWGQGITTEAFRAVLHFAFTENDVYRIACGCLAENAGSWRVMQKCGLVHEATLKERQWHDGRLGDQVEYRLLRAQWRAGQQQKGETP